MWGMQDWPLWLKMNVCLRLQRLGAPASLERASDQHAKCQRHLLNITPQLKAVIKENINWLKEEKY